MNVIHACVYTHVCASIQLRFHIYKIGQLLRYPHMSMRNDVVLFSSYLLYVYPIRIVAPSQTIVVALVGDSFYRCERFVHGSFVRIVQAP